MRIKLWLFLSVFPLLLTQTSLAEEVKYTPVQPLADQQLSLRQTWDKTGQFCYLEDGAKEKKCLTISQMGEIKIRDKGDWSQAAQDQSYIEQLSPEEKATAGGFYKLYVRYLAFGNSNQFAVHIFFLNRPGTNGKEDLSQTIFEFGSVNAGNDVQVDSMSFSNGLETVGAILGAGISLSASGVKPTDATVYAEIVKANLPLLMVGAKMVKVFVDSNPKSGRLP